MNKERLLKVADFLDKLPEEKFDFSTFFEEEGKPMIEALEAGAFRCGTVACAIGWCPAIFPNEVKWKRFDEDSLNPGVIRAIVFPNGDTNFLGAAKFFDLSKRDTEYLFNPGGYYTLDSFVHRKLNSLTMDSSPQEVADHIRVFVENN